MAIPPKDGKLLYHLTALDNLETILSKGLCCRNSLKGLDDINFCDIADNEIIGKREGFNLEDYVPFHFFAGTPFAGGVQQCHKDKEFVYITITRDYACKQGFKIIPSHPLHYNDKPLDWREGLEKIDWLRLESRDYHSQEDKNACMAEAISPCPITANNISIIYVKTQKVQAIVQQYLSKGFGVKIKVLPTMFVGHD